MQYIPSRRPSSSGRLSSSEYRTKQTLSDDLRLRSDPQINFWAQLSAAASRFTSFTSFFATEPISTPAQTDELSRIIESAKLRFLVANNDNELGEAFRLRMQDQSVPWENEVRERVNGSFTDEDETIDDLVDRLLLEYCRETAEKMFQSEEMQMNWGEELAAYNPQGDHVDFSGIQFSEKTTSTTTTSISFKDVSSEYSFSDVTFSADVSPRSVRRSVEKEIQISGEEFLDQLKEYLSVSVRKIDPAEEFEDGISFQTKCSDALRTLENQHARFAKMFSSSRLQNRIIEMQRAGDLVEVILYIERQGIHAVDADQQIVASIKMREILEVMKSLNLTVSNCSGNGDCMFEALGKQLEPSMSAADLRRTLADWVESLSKEHRKSLSEFSASEVLDKDYISRLRQVAANLPSGVDKRPYYGDYTHIIAFVFWQAIEKERATNVLVFSADGIELYFPRFYSDDSVGIKHEHLSVKRASKLLATNEKCVFLVHQPSGIHFDAARRKNSAKRQRSFIW